MSAEEADRLLRYAHSAPAPVSRQEFLAALEQADPETTAGGETLWRVGGFLLARVRPHGSIVFYDPASSPGGTPRRLCALDPGGEVIEWNRWSDTRGLIDARLRLPNGRWLRLVPGEGEPRIWQRADRIDIGESRTGEQWQTLTSQEAIDYEAIDHIPAAWEPNKLTGGGGSILLNFLAQLLIDQGMSAVRYRGRYPTGHLFDALQESFAPVPGNDESLQELRARFCAQAEGIAFGEADASPEIAFAPKPFELCTLEDGSAVFLRGGPEKIFAFGTNYALVLPESTRQSGARRIWKRPDSKKWEFGLLILGAPIEVHGRLDLFEQAIDALAPSQKSGERFVPAELYWRDGLLLCAFAQAPAALGASLLELMDEVHVGFRPLPRDLARLAGIHVLIREGLHDLFIARAAGRPGNEQIELALMLVREVAGSLTPALLGLSQRRLEEAGAEERARLLSPDALESARAEIQRRATALPELLKAIVSGSALR
ncbi:MAG: hypothetical protein KDH09_00755 [Chrysiogenetes bacterium]|nr:hypothetical protein [Chrysiogenetes bacterium]